MTENKSNFKKGLWIVLGVVLSVIIILIILGWMFISGLGKAVDKTVNNPDREKRSNAEIVADEINKQCTNFELLGEGVTSNSYIFPSPGFTQVGICDEKNYITVSAVNYKLTESEKASTEFKKDEKIESLFSKGIYFTALDDDNRFYIRLVLPASDKINVLSREQAVSETYQYTDNIVSLLSHYKSLYGTVFLNVYVTSDKDLSTNPYYRHFLQIGIPGLDKNVIEENMSNINQVILDLRIDDENSSSTAIKDALNNELDRMKNIN